MAEVTVIGGGLAGCEAAWQLAEAGFSVRLLEMKPVQYTPAHHYEGLAELVCSNSLKADRLNSAAGLLKAEMTRLGSLLMQCARKSAVAAGGALAVDRKQFSDLATEAIRNHPNITLETTVVTEIPDTPTVVATGPLTEGALAADIEKRCGTRLSFFDAAAPIVSFESLDKEKVFFAARYGRGDADYINCPMNKAEYEEFYQALIGAERAPLHDCDKDAFRVYEGCMPIEVLASRGMDTMRFGPLKPVGLTDPRTGHRPWAVVQLRRENQEGTMYNLVGFQTNLKFPEQKRVFSMIPGLEHAEFHRYGVMHRNSFLDSPRLLDADYHFRGQDGLYLRRTDDRCGGLYGIGGKRHSCRKKPGKTAAGQAAADSPAGNYDGSTGGIHQQCSHGEFPADGCQYGHSAGSAGANPRQTGKVSGIRGSRHGGTGTVLADRGTIKAIPQTACLTALHGIVIT